MTDRISLPDDVRDALRAERQSPDPPDALRAEILARVTATIGLPPMPGGGSHGPAQPAVAKAVSVAPAAIQLPFTLTGVAATVGVTLALAFAISIHRPPVHPHAVLAPVVRSARVIASSAVQPPPTAPAEPVAVTPAPVPEATVLAPTVNAVPPSVTVRRTTAPVRHGNDFEAGQRLLNQAEESFRDHRPDTALSLLRQVHAADPDDDRAEDVNAYIILALAQRGDLEQARTQAAAFLREHPQSLYRDRVQQAVAAPSP